jgi:hypothetical protein
MTDVVAVDLDGQILDLQIDHEAFTWLPFEASDTDLLEERAFPLIAVSHGRRYELFCDGTFDEAER